MQYKLYMTTDIPYHVVENILQIADLSIDSKIAFKIHKPIIILPELDKKLTQLYKKRIDHIQYNYKLNKLLTKHHGDSADAILFNIIIPNTNSEIILRKSTKHFEYTINKYLSSSPNSSDYNRLDYRKTYNAYSGELISSYKVKL